MTQYVAEVGDEEHYYIKAYWKPRGLKKSDQLGLEIEAPSGEKRVMMPDWKKMFEDAAPVSDDITENGKD